MVQAKTVHWAVLSTAKHQTYIEVQGGPLSDQSIKKELQPKETKWHVEYWFPTDAPLIFILETFPLVALRPLTAVPLFQWARLNEVQVWQNLQQAHNKKQNCPRRLPLKKILWPPSGMEHLDAAFQYAITHDI